MRQAVVYLDNYMLGHAEAWAEAAAARGLDVIAIGGVGETGKLSKAAESIELEKLDRPSLGRALGALDSRYSIRALRCPFGIPQGGELLAGIAADVRAERGLAGPSRSALEIANNKYLTRLALRRAGLEKLDFALVETSAEARRFATARGAPVLLKPLTGVGASLVARCCEPDSAQRRFEEYLSNVTRAHHAPLRVQPYEARCDLGDFTFDPQHSALIEDYVAGPELSVECLCIGGEVVPLIVHDKVGIEEADWTVREHVLVAPALRFPPRQVAQIKEYAAACVRAIGLTDTLCHVELRLRDGREPVLLEINPRIGAGCVRDSLETFWRCDQYEAELDLALGQVPRLSVFERTNQPHAMIFLFSERSGRLARLAGLDKVLRQPGVLAVRAMSSEQEAVGGELEENFLVGVWRRLESGQSPAQAYQSTRAAVDIQVMD